MILFLILLVLALAAIGVFAAQNTGAHDITLWQWHWSAVADWVPVVIAAGVVALLFVLFMAYAGARSGLRHGALRRRITTHEGTIGDLRKENQHLREENARLKSEVRGMRSTDLETRATEPAAAPQPRTVREAPAYHGQPSIGTRVRSFFSGREPAGY